MSCKTCQHWKPTTEGDEGECRRRSPVVVVDPPIRPGFAACTRTVWPITGPEDGCGDGTLCEKCQTTPATCWAYTGGIPNHSGIWRAELMAEHGVEIRGEGRPLWLQVADDCLTMEIGAEMTFDGSPVSAGPNLFRQCSWKLVLSEEKAAPWRELAQRHPDRLPWMFFALDCYKLKGRGIVYVVKCPTGVRVDEVRTWRGRPVLVDGVLYNLGGVEVHGIGGNPLWGYRPLGLLVSQPLEWQPFPGMKPPEWKPAPGALI